MYYSQSFLSDLFHLWHHHGNAEIEYFKLGDLLDTMMRFEICAYGFGSQVDLNNGEIVYFVL